MTMNRLALKLAFTAGLALAGALCSAQTFKIMPVGAPNSATGEYSLNPTTTLVVDLTVRQESITTGPYAKFAQKYFGVIAPLSDKNLYEITGVNIEGVTSAASLDNPTPQAQPTVNVTSHIATEEGFGKVQYDKTSFTTRTAEDTARDAAQAIFNIRKRRAELVMGDVGENVYGAGMSAALERLDEMENQYLELFFGKQIVSEYTVRLYLTPESGKDSYIICRFSDTQGVVSDTDLSGQPIMLELKGDGKTAAFGDSKSRGKGEQEYAIAENVTCKVTDGIRDYGKAVVPVFQFGRRASL